MTTNFPPTDLSKRRADLLPAVLAASCLMNVFLATAAQSMGRSEIFFAFTGMLGLFSAQGALLAIWAALGPGRFVNRFLKSLMIAVPLVVAAGFGFWVGMESLGSAHNLVENIWAAVCLLPVVALAAQTPLLILRRVTRICLVDILARPSDSANSRSQFDLRTMMLFTTIIAAAVGGVSIAVPTVRTRPLEAWVNISVACLVIAGVCLVVAIPSVLIYRVASRLDKRATYASLYVLTWLAGVVLVPMLFFGALPPVEALFHVTTSVFSFFASALGGIFLGLSVWAEVGFYIRPTSNPRRPSQGNFPKSTDSPEDQAALPNQVATARGDMEEIASEHDEPRVE
ncbi:MAG: hypothetical protein KDA42_01500 [Planctomycetales bacterium]|nr:hypothetical protein [Planctomycetales bacterium]